MPPFIGSITDDQADAIVLTIYRYTRDRSMTAAIVCDAVHEDITLQPLHDAYARLRPTMQVAE